MTDLVRPDVSYADSWFAAFEEFGRAFLDGSGSNGPVEGEMTRERFEAMVAARLAASDPATPLEPGWVHCTFLWIVEGDEFLGNLAIRHSLTPFLLEQGGHIGVLGPAVASPGGPRQSRPRPGAAVVPRPRHRPGAGHLRRRQRGLAPDHRGQRGRAGGRPGRQASVLDRRVR